MSVEVPPSLGFTVWIRGYWDTLIPFTLLDHYHSSTAPFLTFHSTPFFGFDQPPRKKECVEGHESYSFSRLHLDVHLSTRCTNLGAEEIAIDEMRSHGKSLMNINIRTKLCGYCCWSALQ